MGSIDRIVILPEGANNWLASGERGISSNAIFTVMTGLNVCGSWGFIPPADPADLIRCEKLLRAVPAFRERLHEMATVSPVWAGLVYEWGSLIAELDREVPGWDKGKTGRAYCTYAAMKRIENSSR